MRNVYFSSQILSISYRLSFPLSFSITLFLSMSLSLSLFSSLCLSLSFSPSLFHFSFCLSHSQPLSEAKRSNYYSRTSQTWPAMCGCIKPSQRAPNVELVPGRCGLSNSYLLPSLDSCLFVDFLSVFSIIASTAPWAPSLF